MKHIRLSLSAAVLAVLAIMPSDDAPSHALNTAVETAPSIHLHNDPVPFTPTNLLDTLPANDVRVEVMRTAMRDLDLTEEEAEFHLYAQAETTDFIDRLYANNSECLAYRAYDPHSRTLTIGLTDQDCLTLADRFADGLHVKVVSTLEAHSLDDLTEIALDVNARTGTEVADVDTQSGDFILYTSELGRIPEQSTRQAPSTLGGVSLPDVKISLRPTTPRAGTVEETCTSTRACGQPLRSGVEIVNDSKGKIASAGFTATAADGSRWLLTTFHDANLSKGQVVRHGEQTIGAVREGVRTNLQDWTRIRISNTYWLKGTKGWAAHPTSQFLNPRSNGVKLNDSPIAINGYAGTYSVKTGDIVCLTARMTRSGDQCGTVEAASTTQMTKVKSYDACRGDSGGGWFLTRPNNQRLAVGIHHGGTGGCPVLNGGSKNAGTAGFSLLTPIYRIHDYMDVTAGQLFRIDHR